MYRFFWSFQMKFSLIFLACYLVASSSGFWSVYRSAPSLAAGRSGGVYWPRSYYRGEVGYYDHPEQVLHKNSHDMLRNVKLNKCVHSSLKIQNIPMNLLARNCTGEPSFRLSATNDFLLTNSSISKR